MATHTFSAAESIVATAAEATKLDGTPAGTPLTAGEDVILWLSDEFDTQSEGSGFRALECTIEYEAISPDTDDTANTPFSFEFVLVLQTKQGDAWLEIGRQNTPIRKISQGANRRIIVDPNSVLDEEGVDQFIQGTGGKNELIKSRFGESAEGNVRFCLVGVDNTPGGANPLVSVTFSIRGKRYNAVA